MTSLILISNPILVVIVEHDVETECKGDDDEDVPEEKFAEA